MSDIALKASIDFKDAENQVKTFVQNTKKSLAEIKAAATGAGGSLAGPRGGAGASPVEQAIKRAKAVDKAYTTWLDSEEKIRTQNLLNALKARDTAVAASYARQAEAAEKAAARIAKAHQTITNSTPAATATTRQYTPRPAAAVRNDSARAYRAQIRDTRAIGSAENMALGVSNRIDRQLGSDPKLQRQLISDLDSALGRYTQTVRMYGANSLQAAQASNAWGSELKKITGVIAEKGGLLRTLNANSSNLIGTIDRLGGSYGGLRRMILNTQVALTALTAAFGIREISATAQQLETIQNTLRAVSADAETSTENFNFLRRAGEEIGFAYADVGRSFAQFSVASTAAGASVEQTQQAFLRITATARNLSLSTADTEGVVRALSQSLSKGRFTAEELRQQLGDRIPIAMAAMAQATGKSGEELEKMMKNGELTTSRFMVPFLNALLSLSGGMEATERNSRSLSAASARMSNAWSDLVLKADSLKMGIASLFDAITTLLRSNFVEEIAKTMGSLLTRLGEGFRSVVSVLDEALTPALRNINENLDEYLGKGIAVVSGLLAGVFVTSVAAATRSVALFTAALMTNPIGLAAAAIGGLVAAYMLYKNETIEIGGTTRTVGELISSTWEMLKTKTSEVFASMSATISQHISSSWVSFEPAIRPVIALLGQLDEPLGTAALSITNILANIPEIARAATNDVFNYFYVLGENIKATFNNTLSTIGVYMDALVDSMRAAMAALLRGDLTSIPEALATSFNRRVEEGINALKTEPITRFESTLRPLLAEVMANSGTASASSFITALVTGLNSGAVQIGTAVANAIPRPAYVEPEDSATRAEIPGNWNRQGVFFRPTPMEPGGGLVRGLDGSYGRPGGAREGSQGASNAVAELMRDLRLQADRAGTDAGAMTAFAEAYRRVADAATNSRQTVQADAQVREALLLVQRRLTREMEAAIRANERNAQGSNRIAAGYRQGTAAGQEAEIVQRAWNEALKYAVFAVDGAGNAVGEYRAAIEALLPSIRNAEQAERNLAASRQIAKNRDDLEVLRLEGQLIGANVNLREEEVEVLRALQAARGASPDILAEVERVTRATVQLRQQNQQIENSWGELSRIGEQAFERIGSAITEAFAKGKIDAISFKNIAKAVFSEVIQAGLKMAVINPILNSIFGGTRGTVGGLFSGAGGVYSGLSSLVGGGTMGGAAGVSNAGSVTGALSTAGQTLALRQAGAFGNLGNAFTGGGLANTGYGFIDGALNTTLVSPTLVNAGTTASVAGAGGFFPGTAMAGEAGSFIGSGAGGVSSVPVFGGSPGLSVAGGLGGALGIAGGAYGIYSGIQKGGIGGAAQIGSGVLSAGASAAMLAGLGSIGPVGWAAIAALAIAGALLPGQKASGKGQLARTNLNTDALSFEGLGGDRFSQDNRDSASNSVAKIADLARQVGDKLGGARIGGNVAVGVTSSRGSGPGQLYLEVHGQKGQFTNDEEGSKQLAEAAMQMVLNEFRSQGTVQGDYRGIVNASPTIEKLDENLRWYEETYKALTKTADMTSEFATQLEAIRKPYDEAIAKARELSLAEDVLTQRRDEAIAKAQKARDAEVANLTDTLEMRRINAGLSSGDLAEARSRVELRQITAAATQEVDQFRARLEALGVSSDEVTYQVDRLIEVQAIEISQRGQLVSAIKNQIGINASNLTLLERAKAAGMGVDAVWLEEAQARVQGVNDIDALKTSLLEMGASAEEVAAQIALLTNIQDAEATQRKNRRIEEARLAAEEERKAAEDARQQLRDNFDNARDAYITGLSNEISTREQSISALQQNTDALKNAALALRDFSKSLLLDSSLSPLTMEQQLNEARAQFDAAYAATRSGTPEERAAAAQRLQSAATSRLNLASSYYAPGTPGYISEFDAVQKALGDTATALEMSKTVEQMSLDTQLAALEVLKAQRDIAERAGQDIIKSLQELRDAFLAAARAAGIEVGGAAEASSAWPWSWEDPRAMGNFGARASGEILYGGMVTAGEQLNAANVNALYQQFLGRDAEAGVAEQWMQFGGRGFDLAAALEQSSEFQARLLAVQAMATQNTDQSEQIATLATAIQNLTAVSAQGSVAIVEAVNSQTEVIEDTNTTQMAVPA